jgi:hypothetical protein
MNKGEMEMNKIYCFINGGSDYFINVLALAEDGNVLAGHTSSNEYWAQHDIGINSDWKHEKYKEHFPDGYELIWLDKPLNDEGFKAALALAEK